MLTLCWGACPGTRDSPTQGRSNSPQPLGTGQLSPPLFQPNWSYELDIPPVVLVNAEGDSRRFVEDVKKGAGAKWAAFVKQ
jgi:hypothetical protein